MDRVGEYGGRSNREITTTPKFQFQLPGKPLEQWGEKDRTSRSGGVSPDCPSGFPWELEVGSWKLTLITMPPFPAKLQSVLDTFDLFPDPANRTNLLLSYADQFRDVSPDVATRPFDRSHQVPQCESDAYVWAMKMPDGTLKLHFAVENPSGVSAKALATILDRSLSGLPADRDRPDRFVDRRAHLPAEHLDGQGDGPHVHGRGGSGAGAPRRPNRQSLIANPGPESWIPNPESRSIAGSRPLDEGRWMWDWPRDWASGLGPRASGLGILGSAISDSGLFPIDSRWGLTVSANQSILPIV